MTPNYYYIIGGVAIIVIAVLIGLVISLQNKLKKFLAGSDVKNLDESFVKMNRSIADLQKFKTELEAYLVTAEARLRRSVQSVSTIRFNPFQGNGSGGKQSFATAFLNEEGDGVVMSSIYSREHVSVLSKPVIQLKSEYELSEEEQQAIVDAEKSIKSISKK